MPAADELLCGLTEVSDNVGDNPLRDARCQPRGHANVADKILWRRMCHSTRHSQ